MKQVIKLEAIGHYRRDASMSWLRMMARFGGLDDVRRVKNPWVARIIGINGGRLNRVFVEPTVDYSEANSVGSRGVYFYFAIDDGYVYEIYEHASWKSSRRYFVWADLGNRTVISREEVESWAGK